MIDNPLIVRVVTETTTEHGSVFPFSFV